MGRTWQLLAVACLLGVVGCGEPGEPAADAVQGGEGVTVETGTAAPAAAESAPAELPPEIDVIPTNE
jgi:hypothetical protein